MVAPSRSILPYFFKPVVTRIRRVDVFEQDGLTVWDTNIPITDGSITSDFSRAERRSLELSIDNNGGYFSPVPNKMWYDKVIKVFTGIRYFDTATSLFRTWECQIGEFMIDRISEPNFPPSVKVTGRDYAKKMLNSKFTQATTFSAEMKLTDIISSLAANSGISASKKIILSSPVILTADAPFDRGTSRWDAAKQLCEAYNFDLFFDGSGNLVMREYNDPVLTPSSFIFKTGLEGNLASFERSVNDSRLFNHYLVSGESSDTIPVYAEAVNDNPMHPASRAEIGDRLAPPFVSPFIVSEGQAQDVANRLLAVSSLQEYDLNFGSLLVPWLDAGDIVTFSDILHNDPTAPTKFLLSSVTIPLNLGPMTGNGKRVVIIGVSATPLNLPSTRPQGASLGGYSDTYGASYG